MLTRLRFKAAQWIILIALMYIPVLGFAASFIGPSGDYGDAPDSQVETASYAFPSAAEDSIDASYIMHYLPDERVFLGNSVTYEFNALVVNQDVDDGWLQTSAQTCTPIQHELQVTMPSTAVAGPIYLNVLFDWNHDGSWAGADAQCPFGTRQPAAALGQPWATPIPLGPFAVEWGVQNLRLDLPPFNVKPGFSGSLLLPAVLTGTQPGQVWIRFTVSTEPVDEQAFLPVALKGQGWNGQGSFIYGETEDYLSCLVETDGQVPAGCPALLAQAQPTDPSPQASQTATPAIPFIPTPASNPASGGNGNDNSSADNTSSTDAGSQDNATGGNQNNNETVNGSSENSSGNANAQGQTSQDNSANQENAGDNNAGDGEVNSDDPNNGDSSEDGAGDKDKQACNAGKGNGSEEDASGQDCDPGNSGEHNNAGDGQTSAPQDDKKDNGKKKDK